MVLSESDLRSIFQDILKQAKADFREAMEYTYGVIYDDLNDMYDSFINDFYSYSTQLYVRHGEVDAGTGIGHNLYEGNRIRMRK